MILPKVFAIMCVVVGVELQFEGCEYFMCECEDRYIYCRELTFVPFFSNSMLYESITFVDSSFDSLVFESTLYPRLRQLILVRTVVFCQDLERLRAQSIAISSDSVCLIDDVTQSTTIMTRPTATATKTSKTTPTTTPASTPKVTPTTTTTTTTTTTKTPQTTTIWNHDVNTATMMDDETSSQFTSVEEWKTTTYSPTESSEQPETAKFVVLGVIAGLVFVAMCAILFVILYKIIRKRPNENGGNGNDRAGFEMATRREYFFENAGYTGDL